MAPMLVFLAAHFVDVPPLEQLAAMAGMSRSHFSRTFHAVAGVTLRDYIRDRRLKRAVELLASGNLSLTEIGLECGFYDLPHFNKAFRRCFGITPKQFRQQAGHSATEQT